MTTVFCALLMYFSMVISESLVARTFGSYTLQLFDVEPGSVLVPLLGVGLLAFAFAVNISGNRLIATFSLWMAVIKIDDRLAAGDLERRDLRSAVDCPGAAARADQGFVCGLGSVHCLANRNLTASFRAQAIAAHAGEEVA